MVKVNPLQARRFAEAIGQRAKTDAVDAAMLARFGALDALQTRPVVSQTISDMKELLVARRGLVKDRVAAANRNHVHRSPLLKALGRSAAALGRAPDRCYRCRPTRPVPGRRRDAGTARHPRQHPGHRRGGDGVTASSLSEAA
jgi:transposase